MKNILILEDSKLEARILSSIVQEVAADCKIFDCRTCEEAYFYAMERTIHLFLIDVKLENDCDFSGFHFVQNIRRVDKYGMVPIIFISSMQGYELMAFRTMHCYDFIAKPFQQSEVKKIINNALQLKGVDQLEECINFEVRGVFYTVNVGDIRYIEFYQRILYIYTEFDQLEIPGQSLRECYHRLNKDLFRQVHKSFVVSRKYVCKLDKQKRLLDISHGKQIDQKYMDGLWEWLNAN